MGPLIPLALGAGSFLGNLFGGGGDDPEEGAADQAQYYEELLRRIPELKELLGMQVQQARSQQPLQQALSQMAMNLMPRSAFNGGARPMLPPGGRMPEQSYAVPRSGPHTGGFSSLSGMSGSARRRY